MSATEVWPQIKAWRKQRRATLIEQRAAASPDERQRWSVAISEWLESGFPLLAGMTIGFCWPFRGEFDARFTIRNFRQHGATAALPEVVAKARPLQFRKWWPGAPMRPGVYGIPVPDGTEIVVPDAAIVPLNGFDEQGYRLGYGGGYFDCTLAATAPRPLAIGVGFELARLPTIQPQPHDIAMDFVVTESGVHAVVDARLVRINAEECRVRAQRLCGERGLPRRPAAAASGYSSPPCYAGEFPGYFGETGDKKS
jgi:5,10-methenyltetrahydrofolate synthetase